MDYSRLSAESLAVECLRSGDEAAWVEFIRRFHALIASVVIRVGCQWGETSTHVVDDVIQETYLKLYENRADVLGKLRSSHENGIYGYVKVLTANLAHDYFKASHCQKRGGGTVVESLDAETEATQWKGASPNAASLDRQLLVKEISSCLKATVARTSPRDQTIFWLYYRVGLSAKAISALPGIALTVKGVESTLQRLTRELKERMGSGREKARSKVSPKGIPADESL